MAIANLALRFLLELAGAAGAGYVAYRLTDGAADPLRWVMAIIAGVVFIGLWGFVVAPRRQNGLSQAQKDVIGTVFLLVVAVAVVLVGQPGLGIAFGVLVAFNAVLLFVFGQEARQRIGPGSVGRG